MDYALLGLLDRQPMHGYDLHRRLSGRTGLGLIWTVKQAQLYGILARFQAGGLIRATVVAGGTYRTVI